MAAEHKQRETKFQGRSRELLSFGAVGILCTMVDIAVFACLVTGGFPPLISNVLAFFVANILGYGLNATLTFRLEGKRRKLTLRGYLKFLSGYLIGLGLSTFIIWRLADPLGPILAKLVASAVTAIWNYTISAFIVFRRPKTMPPDPTESA